MGLFGSKNKKYTDKEISTAIENLFRFTGNDLPIINSDGYDYISRIWKNVGVVYECCNIIYKKVIKCPLVIYEMKDANSSRKYQALKDKSTPQALVLKAKAYKEVHVDALEKLLNNPNPQQDYNNLIGVILISYLCTGNAYLWNDMSKGTGRPLYFWGFPNLKINSGGMYDPVKSYTQFDNTTSSKNYLADDVYHIKTPNPEFDTMGTQLYGVSPLRAFLEPLRTIEEATKQASKQMRNGGVLGMFSPKNQEDKFMKDQRDAFMVKFKDALRGKSEGSRYLTASFEMLYQQVGLPSAELELLAIKSATEESIYRLFGIPLARYSQKASTQNNQKESNSQLITDAVAPVCDVISKALTESVASKFGNYVIELDYTQLEELSANMKEVTDYLVRQLQHAIISPDEARFVLKYGETDQSHMKDYYYNGKLLKNIYNGESKNNNGGK